MLARTVVIHTCCSFELHACCSFELRHVVKSKQTWTLRDLLFLFFIRVDEIFSRADDEFSPGAQWCRKGNLLKSNPLCFMA